jgi:hypothetical protein
MPFIGLLFDLLIDLVSPWVAPGLASAAASTPSRDSFRTVRPHSDASALFLVGLLFAFFSAMQALVVARAPDTSCALLLVASTALTGIGALAALCLSFLGRHRG